MCGRQCDRMSLALLVVRLALGSIFFLHGAQKVFGWFGGSGLKGFVSWIGTFGIPSFVAYLAAFAELIGGILLFSGIAAELGALMSIAVMLGAVFAVHWPHGYFAQQGGYEYPLNLIFFALAIVIGGPGAFALWDPIQAYKSRICGSKE